MNQRSDRQRRSPLAFPFRGRLSGNYRVVRAVLDHSGMAQNFIGCDRDQSFLMPPDVRDWLPEDHLVWFVLGAVAGMDRAGSMGRIAGMVMGRRRMTRR